MKDNRSSVMDYSSTLSVIRLWKLTDAGFVDKNIKIFSEKNYMNKDASSLRILAIDYTFSVFHAYLIDEREPNSIVSRMVNSAMRRMPNHLDVRHKINGLKNWDFKHASAYDIFHLTNVKAVFYDFSARSHMSIDQKVCFCHEIITHIFEVETNNRKYVRMMNFMLSSNVVDSHATHSRLRTNGILVEVCQTETRVKDL